MEQIWDVEEVPHTHPLDPCCTQVGSFDNRRWVRRFLPPPSCPVHLALGEANAKVPHQNLNLNLVRTPRGSNIKVPGP